MEKTRKSKKVGIFFHGLPQVNLHKGDPYHCYCHKTARLIADELKLEQDDYFVTFSQDLENKFG